MNCLIKTICTLAIAGFAMMPLSAKAAAPTGTWAFTIHFFDVANVARAGGNNVNMSSDTSHGTVVVAPTGVARGRVDGGLDINAGLFNKHACVRKNGVKVGCKSKFAVGSVWDFSVKTINQPNRGFVSGRFTLVGNRVTVRMRGMPVMRGYISLNKQMIILEGNNTTLNQNATMTMIKIK